MLVRERVLESGQQTAEACRCTGMLFQYQEMLVLGASTVQDSSKLIPPFTLLMTLLGDVTLGAAAVEMKRRDWKEERGQQMCMLTHSLPTYVHLRH